MTYNPYGFKNRFRKKKGTLSDHRNVIPGITDPIIFSNHTGENCLDSRIFYSNLPQFYQATFIDPGKVSCGIRIVRYFIEQNSIELLWFGIHNFGLDIDEIIIGMEKELQPI